MTIVIKAASRQGSQFSSWNLCKHSISVYSTHLRKEIKDTATHHGRMDWSSWRLNHFHEFQLRLPNSGDPNSGGQSNCGKGCARPPKKRAIPTIEVIIRGFGYAYYVPPFLVQSVEATFFLTKISLHGLHCFTQAYCLHSVAPRCGWQANSLWPRRSIAREYRKDVYAKPRL